MLLILAFFALCIFFAASQLQQRRRQQALPIGCTEIRPAGKANKAKRFQKPPKPARRKPGAEPSKKPTQQGKLAVVRQLQAAADERRPTEKTQPSPTLFQREKQQAALLKRLQSRLEAY